MCMYALHSAQTAGLAAEIIDCVFSLQEAENFVAYSFCEGHKPRDIERILGRGHESKCCLLKAWLFYQATPL